MSAVMRAASCLLLTPCFAGLKRGKSESCHSRKGKGVQDFLSVLASIHLDSEPSLFMKLEMHLRCGQVQEHVHSERKPQAATFCPQNHSKLSLLFEDPCEGLLPQREDSGVCF